VEGSSSDNLRYCPNIFLSGSKAWDCGLKIAVNKTGHSVRRTSVALMACSDSAIKQPLVNLRLLQCCS